MSGGRPWGEFDDDVLRRLYPTMRNGEIARLLGRTESAVRSRANLLRLRKAEGYQRNPSKVWTPERREWFRAFVPGHSEAEIAAEHERVFGWPLTRAQVSNGKQLLGVRSGTAGGRFAKGHVPANKGRTWGEFMSPEGQARSRENVFRKGQQPHNAVPLLSTRLSKEGIPMVKVRTHPRPGRASRDCWEPLGILNWERANHREWPDGCRCVYADHDSSNCSAENVVPVPKELYVTVTGFTRGHVLEYHDRESLETAVAYARVVRERARVAREGRRERGHARHDRPE